MPPLPNAHFDIDASIVFQLGEDLISDVVQALVELVKNAYDADASYAKITVDTNGSVPDERSFFPNATSYILIEDNGIGMDEDTIRQGWLTISRSPKRELKRRNATTEKGRTPLGDKGLGRLGVQRLGLNVEIFTKPTGQEIVHHVGWNWQDFRGDVTLTKVPVRWEHLKSKGKPGTKILISHLREPEQWEAGAQKSIVTALSQLISPYAEFRDFEIIGSLNGKDLELAAISTKVRQSSQLRYRVTFDENAFRIVGRARLDFLRPTSKKDLPAFDQLVAEDTGDAFFEFLSTQGQASRFNLRKLDKGNWFVAFQFARDFDDIDGLERVAHEPEDRALPVSPGPFKAEIDAFRLGPAQLAKQSSLDTVSEYRALIRDLSGVRIYRDGFGVRVDRDWLALGAQWTGAGSYYGLKPENTLGFVALTAKDNAALVETTDREGFKNTPAYRNFLRLFSVFRQFAHDAQEFLRRGWIDFRNEHQRELAGVSPGVSAEELAATITKQLRKVASYKRTAEDIRDTFVELQADSDQVFENAQTATSNDTRLSRQVEKAKADFDKRIGKVRSLMAQILQDFESASQLVEVNTLLQAKLAILESQLEQSVEVMSLGLTAEVLAHEIANIVDQLADRTKGLSGYMSRKGVEDSTIVGYVEHVRTMTNGLRTQLAHLTPSLKFARTRRSPIALDEFSADLAKYHQKRWTGVPLTIVVQPASPFTVRINKGKLTQVFDNLILNSEYWLKEDIRAGRLSQGSITIRIAEPFVRINDNGRGIDPSVETTLFEPFVTCKKDGRGLGLYIVQQLLDAEGCFIRLKARRNSSDRLYQFEIDFSGCVIDGAS